MNAPSAFHQPSKFALDLGAIIVQPLALNLSSHEPCFVNISSKWLNSVNYLLEKMYLYANLFENKRINYNKLLKIRVCDLDTYC